MDLEKVLVVRPDAGRLAVTVLIVTPTYADSLVDELVASAAPGEDVMIVRADGEELQPVAVKVPLGVADRIIGDALLERVL